MVSRAWFVAHRGPAALVAGAIASALFGIFGTVSIQVWGAQRELPLWAVAPGTLVMIVGTALDSSLDRVLAVEPSWIRAARLLWSTVIVAAAALLALPTALALGDPSIGYATALLAVAAFGPALVDVRFAAALGAVVDVLAVVYGGQVVGDREMSTVLAEAPDFVWPAVLVPGIVGLVIHVVRGPRHAGRALGLEDGA